MNIRPTRLGYAFAGIVLLTLIGCINYGLSLGYGLTFLLGGLWIMSGAMAARNLAALSVHIRLTSNDPNDWLAVHLAHAGKGTHAQISLHVTQQETHTIQTSGWVDESVIWSLQTPITRGPVRIHDVSISSVDVLGLWQSSRHLSLDLQHTLYAQAEVNAPEAPKEAGEGEGTERTTGHEELFGLRPYVTGDSPKLISWRHAARGSLLVKEFDAPMGQTLVLNYHQMAGTHEQKLSRLAAWVQTDQPFSLILPHASLATGRGEAHSQEAQRMIAVSQPWPNKSESLPHELLSYLSLRHSLFALGVALLGGFGRWPWWCVLVCLGLLAYRGYQGKNEVIKQHSDTQSLLLVLLGIGLIGGVFLHIGTLMNLGAITAILGILISLKAIETRTARDAKLLSLLGIFLLITYFFSDQGPLTTLHSLVSVFLLLWALVGWFSPQKRHPHAGRSVAGLLLISVPLATFLFFFFPRIEPLWRMPFSSGNQTGLSDEISAGSLTDLAQSDAVAFRAEFKGDLPPEQERYWRGPVYENFDGIKWTQARFRFQAPSITPIQGSHYEYTLTQEPNGRPWILALDTPSVQNLPKNIYPTSAFQLIAPRPPTMRTRYELQSQIAKLGQQEDEHRLRLNQIIPAGNPRAVALAESWRSLPPKERIQAALSLLHTGGFSYTLSPPVLDDINRIDAFLFESKQGFCEHYASSFGFLMRAAGLPTRVIAGYQGGEVGIGQHLTIRQREAHAWNEVWLEGEGWVRVDPTMAVAPARATTNLATALAQPNASTPKEPTTLDRIRLRIDSFQNGWNNWVAAYNTEQQKTVLQRFGLGEINPYSVFYIGGILGIVGIFLKAMFFVSARFARPKDPAAATLYDLSQRLDLPKEIGETASDYAKRASYHYPTQRGLLEEIATLFNEWRYSQQSSANHLQQLQQKIREVRRK